MNRITQISVITVIMTLMASGCATKPKNSVEKYTNEAVKTLYDKGKKALDNGNYNRAAEYYAALETNFPFGPYTEQGKLDFIYTLVKLKRVEEAIRSADQFIQLYPTHANIDYAYYMKGVANFSKKQSRLDRLLRGKNENVRDQKPLRQSLAAFEELINRYPQSAYTPDAKQRVIYIRNGLAKAELSVAQYYFDSKAYVATVNRCKYIIFRYETSPSAEDALVLMEKAYSKMGLTELAASTRLVINDNFPHSTHNTSPKKDTGILRRILGIIKP